MSATLATTVQIALYQEIRDDVTIGALVAGRIAPVGHVRKFETYPLITYRRESRDSVHVLGDITDIAESTFEIDCWDNNANDASTIADVIELLLDNFNGTLGTTTTVTVDRCFLIDREQAYEDPNDGTNVFRYVDSLRFSIWHR